jgi:hypothetical protein
MNFYQYEPPVAMFSMAEVDKYNRYEGTGMALFAMPYGMGGAAQPQQRVAPAAPKKVHQAIRDMRRAKNAVLGVGKNDFYGTARSGAIGGYGMAKSGARGLGGYAERGLRFGARKGGELMNSAADLIKANPGRAGALLAVGGAGAYFLRRRRSKTGKMIVEQVRR